MDDKTFIDKIHTPYNKAWKIVKLLQFAGCGGFSMEQVTEYWKAVEEYEKEFAGNEFAMFLLNSVLIHADTIIIRMNEKGETTK